MAKLIRPPDNTDVTRFLIMLFLRTERELIAEIERSGKKAWWTMLRQHPWNGCKGYCRGWWMNPGITSRP